jgi:hypothetical protein
MLDGASSIQLAVMSEPARALADEQSVIRPTK